MDVQKTAQQICEIGARLYNKQLVAAAEGNISVRTGENEILITPAGVCKGRMSPSMLLRCNLQGEALESNAGYQPSSEIRMHLRVYLDCPHANAVVHAHPPVATAFSVHNTVLNSEGLPNLANKLDSVPVCPYARSGTEEVPASIAPYLPTHRALLLAKHGALTWAENLECAYSLMESIERIAKGRA